MCKVLNISIAVLLLAGATDLADWDPGDGHKMHFPQLSDANGWDIEMVSAFGPGVIRSRWLWARCVSWPGEEGHSNSFRKGNNE